MTTARTGRRQLAEYLFLDRLRIARYFQQLSAPVQYDKVPVWKVALGITGPTVEASQDRSGREFTFQEKLETVLKHLRTEGLLCSSRQSLYTGHSDEQPFVEETITARRVRVPNKEQDILLWVSPSPEAPESFGNFKLGALFLIEDFQGEDSRQNMYSSYSSLWLLAHELPQDSEPTLALRKKSGTVEERFARDPLGVLKSLGAKLGPERRVTSIYRTRASCVDMEGPVSFLTTVGYPLVVAAASA